MTDANQSAPKKTKRNSKRESKKARAEAADGGVLKDPGGRSASYSTRLTAEQRDLIEQAASLKQWSAATLIRNAAIQYAADIVNSSGATNQTIQRLASELAEAVIKPACTLSNPRGLELPGPEGVDYEVRYNHDWECPPELSEPLRVAGIKFDRLSDERRDEIVNALLTCGFTFGQALADYLQGRSYREERESYSPQVDPRSLLGD